MNMDFYDNILDDDKEEIKGVEFNLTSNFRIIDYGKGFGIEFHKFLKRSFKGYENQFDIILKNSPIDIKDVYGIELDDFKINKLYRGYFIVHFYENNLFDIFLKTFDNV